MELTTELLLSAYSQGMFPMATSDGRIRWYSPDPRAIIPLDRFHASRSLRRLIRAGTYTVTIDAAFPDVIRACAQPAEGREETWISLEIISAYERLHEIGFAHSVETWLDGQLVGGLYGVSLRGLFAGESMFSRRPSASKVALLFLVEHLRLRKFLLLDVQFQTAHLKNLGAVELARSDYLNLLGKAMTIHARF